MPEQQLHRAILTMDESRFHFEQYPTQSLSEWLGRMVKSVERFERIVEEDAPESLISNFVIYPYLGESTLGVWPVSPDGVHITLVERQELTDPVRSVRTTTSVFQETTAGLSALLHQLKDHY